MEDVFLYETRQVCHDERWVEVIVFEANDIDHGMSISCEQIGPAVAVVAPLSNEAAALMNEVRNLLNRIYADVQHRVQERIQMRSTGDGIDVDMLNAAADSEDESSDEGFYYELRSQALPTWEDSIRFVVDKRFREGWGGIDNNTTYYLDDGNEDDSFYATIRFSGEPSSRWFGHDEYGNAGLGVAVTAPISTRLFHVVQRQGGRRNYFSSDSE